MDLVTVAAATALRQPNARSNEPMSSDTKSLAKTQNFNLPKHGKKIILENPLPTNQYWAKILGGELKSYYCRSQSQKSFNPDWWRPKSSLFISINTEEFQKFLQPMMKLKNQVAHINQQSFTHPTINTLKLKNLSLLICWINTELFLQNWKQSCWYWGGGGAAAAVGYNFYFFFPFFLSFFLSQCFWWNPIPQGNK